MALLELQGVSKIYQSEGVETSVLSDVSFSIEKGEFVAIMGPSGSGKSTLLHILGFLDPASHGTYRFQGKTINDYSSAEIAHVRNTKMGFVFQAFNLLPRIKVLEQVQLPLLYSDISPSEWKPRALQALETVGLSHRLNHEPSQLSGGEKQRVAIARALVTNPEVIFADEPTGNLDSKSGLLVMKTIQTLNEKNNHTVILITHETYTAEHAHRIIRIRDGQVEADTTVQKRRSSESFAK